jgi:hypothetical protein
MIDLPSIFDSRGTFTPLPDAVVANFDEARRASYAKLSKASAELKAADTAVAQSMADIKSANDAVTEQEAFMRKAFPKREFHDLWREAFKG